MDTEAIRFYCGVSEVSWNREPTAPGPYACISPVWGQKAGMSEARRMNYVQVPGDTLVIQDSGAFSDRANERLSPEACLERQQRHAERFGYAGQVTHRASYDFLVPYKGRDEDAASVEAVKATVAGARFLDRHRDTPGLVLSAQGATPSQYLTCSQRILPYLESGDLFGLGGWCATGKFIRAFLPVFRETMALLIPFLGWAGVKRVHIWGVLFARALGELLYLCDQAGIKLSTDSAGPALRPCMGRWGYAGWTNPNYKKPPLTRLGAERTRHVEATWQWLASFRSTPFYRPIPVHTRARQLRLMEA